MLGECDNKLSQELKVVLQRLLPSDFSLVDSNVNKKKIEKLPCDELSNKGREDINIRHRDMLPSVKREKKDFKLIAGKTEKDSRIGTSDYFSCYVKIERLCLDSYKNSSSKPIVTPKNESHSLKYMDIKKGTKESIEEEIKGCRNFKKRQHSNDNNLQRASKVLKKLPPVMGLVNVVTKEEPEIVTVKKVVDITKKTGGQKIVKESSEGEILSTSEERSNLLSQNAILTMVFPTEIFEKCKSAASSEQNLINSQRDALIEESPTNYKKIKFPERMGTSDNFSSYVKIERLCLDSYKNSSSKPIVTPKNESCSLKYMDIKKETKEGIEEEIKGCRNFKKRQHSNDNNLQRASKVLKKLPPVMGLVNVVTKEEPEIVTVKKVQRKDQYVVDITKKTGGQKIVKSSEGEILSTSEERSNLLSQNALTTIVIPTEIFGGCKSATSSEQNFINSQRDTLIEESLTNDKKIKFPENISVSQENSSMVEDLIEEKPPMSCVSAVNLPHENNFLNRDPFIVKSRYKTSVNKSKVDSNVNCVQKIQEMLKDSTVEKHFLNNCNDESICQVSKHSVKSPLAPTEVSQHLQNMQNEVTITLLNTNSVSEVHASERLVDTDFLEGDPTKTNSDKTNQILVRQQNGFGDEVLNKNCNVQDVTFERLENSFESESNINRSAKPSDLKTISEINFSSGQTTHKGDVHCERAAKFSNPDLATRNDKSISNPLKVKAAFEDSQKQVTEKEPINKYPNSNQNGNTSSKLIKVKSPKCLGIQTQNLSQTHQNVCRESLLNLLHMNQKLSGMGSESKMAEICKVYPIFIDSETKQDIGVLIQILYTVSKSLTLEQVKTKQYSDTYHKTLKNCSKKFVRTFKKILMLDQNQLDKDVLKKIIPILYLHLDKGFKKLRQSNDLDFRIVMKDIFENEGFTCDHDVLLRKNYGMFEKVMNTFGRWLEDIFVDCNEEQNFNVELNYLQCPTCEKDVPLCCVCKELLSCPCSTGLIHDQGSDSLTFCQAHGKCGDSWQEWTLDWLEEKEDHNMEFNPICWNEMCSKKAELLCVCRLKAFCSLVCQREHWENYHHYTCRRESDSEILHVTEDELLESQLTP